MEPRREKLSDLLHGSALPPPPIKRALIFGIIAAVIGVVAVVMAVLTHEMRIGHLTAGIGALVGIAIIRRGGYGKPLALASAAITLAAIPVTYFVTFRIITTSWCTESTRESIKENAAAWQQLSNPTDEQVFEFARDQGFAFTTREAFDHYPGKMLTWFAETQPSVSEWRDWELANSLFRDYLAYTTSALDYVLLAVALLLAAGIVMLRTSTLEDRAKQKAIARRQEAAREGNPEEPAPN
tara:strand:+ start:1879 stop:2598 length:720 start_codon:yes stop_codon:yes gene_type:complete